VTRGHDVLGIAASRARYPRSRQRGGAPDIMSDNPRPRKAMHEAREGRAPNSPVPARSVAPGREFRRHGPACLPTTPGDLEPRPRTPSARGDRKSPPVSPRCRPLTHLEWGCHPGEPAHPTRRPQPRRPGGEPEGAGLHRHLAATRSYGRGDEDSGTPRRAPTPRQTREC
jgi:hypothetical protein